VWQHIRRGTERLRGEARLGAAVEGRLDKRFGRRRSPQHCRLAIHRQADTIGHEVVAVLAEDYIVMAEAKGLPQRLIMYAYAMRNAILHNFTQFGMSLGFVISGQLLTEMVFSYPGLGFYLVRSVQTHDYPLMQALFLMITLAVLGANFIVDLLYIRLDPRVRTS
jgi:ABC-type dipeptide/oligopeptide/nickel transport system permease component